MKEIGTSDPDSLIGEIFTVLPPHRLILDSAGPTHLTSDSGDLHEAVFITQRTCPDYLLYLQEHWQPKVLILFSGCPETVRQGLSCVSLPGKHYIGPLLSSPLTACERLALHRLAQGDSNKQIGQHLNKSASTIKNQIHSMLGKMSFVSRHQLIEYYVRRPAVGLKVASD
jgi:DNA-binding CsgD family transcriptional regulator